MTTFLTLGLHLIGKIRFTESKVTSDPDPDPSSRMRIRIKMIRVRNTADKAFKGHHINLAMPFSHEVISATLGEPHSSLFPVVKIQLENLLLYLNP